MLKTSIFVMALSCSQALFAQDQSCKVSCPGGSDVTVDVQAKCLCLSNSHDCFSVITGQKAEQTANGTGVIHSWEGARFQTQKGPGSTGFDSDALAVGIPANDSSGKLLSKAHNCQKNGSTWGSIAIPCDKWLAVKKQMGKRITICGGSNSGSAPEGTPDSSPGLGTGKGAE